MSLSTISKYCVSCVLFQSQKGHKFETETDTEVVAKLIKHLYDNHKDQHIKFRELVEMTVAQIVRIVCHVTVMYMCCLRVTFSRFLSQLSPPSLCFSWATHKGLIALHHCMAAGEPDTTLLWIGYLSWMVISENYSYFCSKWFEVYFFCLMMLMIMVVVVAAFISLRLIYFILPLIVEILRGDAIGVFGLNGWSWWWSCYFASVFQMLSIHFFLGLLVNKNIAFKNRDSWRQHKKNNAWSVSEAALSGFSAGSKTVWITSVPTLFVKLHLFLENETEFCLAGEV